MVFNCLVDVRNRVRQAWSLVDIQLKRRFDLIPNLVNCVKGYRDHESQLQTELAALRNQLDRHAAGRSRPGSWRGEQDRSSASPSAIPNSRRTTHFSRCKKRLSDTEQRIALARSYFNEIATHYNTRLEIVPERYVAKAGRDEAAAADGGE